MFFDVKSNWCTFPENVTCDPRTPNAPITTPPVPIDPSMCFWVGETNNVNGTYMKSLCYYPIEASYGEASLNCQKHGMRLMRVENSSDQTETINYLNRMFGLGTNGIYYASGKEVNGSWLHDDSTPIYENMLWRSGRTPDTGCVVINNVGFMSFDAIPCDKTVHSICEFRIPF